VALDRPSVRPQQYRARVSAVRTLAAEILEVDLAMEDPPELRFEAGQWVSVPFGPKNVRAYSIASTPRSPGRITLCADVGPGGIGSAWFRRLRVGDVVDFKAPFGGFVFRREDPRRPLFVAEEIGIVPIRAILTELQASGFERPATLVYRGRDPAWLPYHDELVSLARRRPDFAYRPVVDSAGDDWRGERGTAAGVVSALARDGADPVAYVAGGADMIDRVREVLMARGVDRKSIRWEKFW
jgi:ferredoxin-NADP reductase